MGLSSKQVSSEGLLQSSSDNSGRGSSMELPKPPIKRQQEEDVQQPPEKLKCPRCDSTNTKFCYYNNYNKSQPRHFCKTCKRHWTKGGMLRNVPVGGGRKNKRLKTSPNTTKTATSANINVQASDQLRLGLQNRLEGESSMRKPLSQTILGPQSLLQDSIFNNSVELCIGKNSSSQSSFNGIFGGFSSALSMPPNHDLQFPCPSFTTLGENYPSSVSGSAHISNLYDLNNGESNALEDSVMTGLDHTSISCSSLNDKPWPSNESTSNWGWDDIDKFVTADVTLPWDDAEIN